VRKNSNPSPSKSTRRDSGRDEDVFGEWDDGAHVPTSKHVMGGVPGDIPPPIPKPRDRRGTRSVAGAPTSEEAVPPLPPQRKHRLSESSTNIMENHYQPINRETLLSTAPSEYVMLDPRARFKGGGEGVNALNGSGLGIKVVNSDAQGVKVDAQGVNGGRYVPHGSGQATKGRTHSSVLDKEAILEDLLQDEEFTECELEICRFALEQQNYDVEGAKEEIRVQILLSMLLPNIREEDCRRALVHCQQKTNRAAAWLIQRSEELQKRVQ
jgi:hypothetical protein